jgi:hypothetical protein
MRRIWLQIAIAGIAALVPSAVWADGQEIAKQIGQNLKTSGALSGYNIGVKVDGSTATLNGTVISAKQMDDALRIAEQTPGIDKVRNNLRVQAPASNAGLRQPTGLFNNSGIQQTANTTPSMPAPQQQQMAMAQYPQQYAAAPQQYAAAPRPLAMNNSPKPITGAHLASRQVVADPGVPVQGMPVQGVGGAPMPTHIPSPNMSPAPMAYDSPNMPNYSWPSYAAHPNYAAVNYPRQYSASAWPYIGPFYPYPQVPMGWRKVTMEWDDGWWMLDFKD